MLFVPLTRAVVDAGYGSLVYLNIDQGLSLSRSADDTHTRIRGTSVYTPEAASAETVIEVLVVETFEQIAALVNAAKPGVRMLLAR